MISLKMYNLSLVGIFEKAGFYLSDIEAESLKIKETIPGELKNNQATSENLEKTTTNSSHFKINPQTLSMNEMESQLVQCRLVYI